MAVDSRLSQAGHDGSLGPRLQEPGDRAGVSTDHLFTCSHQIIHLLARQSETGADRDETSSCLGIGIIGEADPQHPSLDIAASKTVDHGSLPAAPGTQLVYQIVDSALEGDQCLDVVGPDLSAADRRKD